MQQPPPPPQKKLFHQHISWSSKTMSRGLCSYGVKPGSLRRGFLCKELNSLPYHHITLIALQININHNRSTYPKVRAEIKEHLVIFYQTRIWDTPLGFWNLSGAATLNLPTEQKAKRCKNIQLIVRIKTDDLNAWQLFIKIRWWDALLKKSSKLEFSKYVIRPKKIVFNKDK